MKTSDYPHYYEINSKTGINSTGRNKKLCPFCKAEILNSDSSNANSENLTEYIERKVQKKLRLQKYLLVAIALALIVRGLWAFGVFERPANTDEATKTYQAVVEETSTPWMIYIQEETIVGSNGWEKPGEVRVLSGVTKLTRNGNIGYTEKEKSWCFGYSVTGARNQSDYEGYICYPLRVNKFTGTISGNGLTDGFRSNDYNQFYVKWYIQN